MVLLSMAPLGATEKYSVSYKYGMGLYKPLLRCFQIQSADI